MTPTPIAKSPVVLSAAQSEMKMMHTVTLNV